MKYGIVLTLILLALGVGYYGGLRSSPPPASSDENWRQKYAQLEEKLKNLSDVDIEEYLRLKEQKDRYEKADEILSKILLIMLHDVGLRATDRQLKTMKANMEAARLAEQAQRQAERQKTSSSRSERSFMTVSAPTSPAPSNVPAPPTVDFAKSKDIAREEDAKEFLRQAELKDFFGALRGGTPLSQEQVELLNGTFVGDVIFDHPRRPPWHVEMIFSGTLTRRGNLRGQHEIKVSRLGEVFSHTRGGVRNENFLSLNGDSYGVILNLGGNTGYFQLYYFPRLNAFYGNVYVKDGVTDYKRAGVVQLVKR